MQKPTSNCFLHAIPALSAITRCRNWSRACSRLIRPWAHALGVTQVFSPDRVVGHPELSLAGGAVRGWDRRNAHYFQLILSLANHYGFDVDTPWQKLPNAVQQAVLYGSGKDKI